MPQQFLLALRSSKPWGPTRPFSPESLASDVPAQGESSRCKNIFVYFFQMALDNREKLTCSKLLAASRLIFLRIRDLAGVRPTVSISTAPRVDQLTPLVFAAGKLLSGVADFCKEMVIPSPTPGTRAAAHTLAPQANPAWVFKKNPRRYGPPCQSVVRSPNGNSEMHKSKDRSLRADHGPPCVAVMGGSAWPEQPPLQPANF